MRESLQAVRGVVDLHGQTKVGMILCKVSYIGQIRRGSDRFNVGVAGLTSHGIDLFHAVFALVFLVASCAAFTSEYRVPQVFVGWYVGPCGFVTGYTGFVSYPFKRLGMAVLALVTDIGMCRRDRPWVPDRIGLDRPSFIEY